MRQASVVQLAVFYLVLLLSHEGITAAEKIRESIHMRHRLGEATKHTNPHRHHHHHKNKHARLRKREGKVVEAESRYAAHDSFLEASAVQGMSVEAMGTIEIIGIHKSLHEQYRYKNSPIAEDLDNLDAIPAGAILSRSALNERRDHITMLLEKANTHSLVLNSPGSKALNDQEAVDKSLSITGGMGAAIFGFVDGYYAGMASELRKMFEDPKCSDPDTVSDLKSKMQAIGHSFKGVYGNLTRLHKAVFSPQGRSEAFDAMKIFGRSLVLFARAAGLYVWGCPGAKFLAQMLLTLMATFIQQLLYTALMAAGGAAVSLAAKGAHALGENGKAMVEAGKNAATAAVDAAKNVANKGIDAANGAIAKTGSGGMISGAMQSMPILAKYSGMLMGLLSSGYYFGKKGYAVCVDAKKMYNQSCDKGCKTNMIENSFAMAGIFAEVMINSGIDQVVKVDRDKSKPFFESFNVGYTDSFKGDMSQLSDAATMCKKGGSFKIPKFGSSPASMMPKGVDKERQEKKEKAQAKYDKECKDGKNACWPAERWEKNYDHLQSPCMHKYKASRRDARKSGGAMPQWASFSGKCDNKGGTIGLVPSPIPFPIINPMGVIKHGLNLKRMFNPDGKDDGTTDGNTTTKRPWATPKTTEELNKGVDRSGIEDTLEKEIYWRVRKSDITQEWRKYLLVTRLHGDVPTCFRKWLNKWNGHEGGNCLEDEPTQPPHATTTDMPDDTTTPPTAPTTPAPTAEPIDDPNEDTTTPAGTKHIDIATYPPSRPTSPGPGGESGPSGLADSEDDEDDYIIPSRASSRSRSRSRSVTTDDPDVDTTTPAGTKHVDIVTGTPSRPTSPGPGGESGPSGPAGLDDDDDDDNYIIAPRASSRSSSRSRSVTVQAAAADSEEKKEEAELEKEDEEDDVSFVDLGVPKTVSGGRRRSNIRRNRIAA